MADDDTKKDDLDEVDEDEAEEAESDATDDDADSESAADDDAEDDDADDDDDAEDNDDAEDDDAEDDDDADDDDADDDDAEDDDDADDDDAEDDDDDAEDDGRAAEVARALGLDDDEDVDASDGEESDEEKALNRAERRRRRAQRRRRRKAKRGADDDGEETRDRNKRKREELIARRRRVAEADDEGAGPDQGLLPSEMVDDALARGGDAALKWVRNNWSWLQWALAAALFGGIGLVAWRYFDTQSVEDTSDALARGIRADEAIIIPPDEDERTEEQKEQDIRVVYASREEQQKAALAAYRTAAEGDGGASLLAKLGEAGVLLERGEWDAAIAAYDVVLGSPLAKADVSVKGRALEGKAFALEGKGDLEAAMGMVTSIGDSKDDFFKILSLYHQGRLLAAQDKDAEATEKLQEARKAAEKAKVDARLISNVHPYQWLDKAIDEALRDIDPKLALPSPGGDSPMKLTPEQLQQKLKERGLSSPGLPQ